MCWRSANLARSDEKKKLCERTNAGCAVRGGRGVCGVVWCKACEHDGRPTLSPSLSVAVSRLRAAVTLFDGPSRSKPSEPLSTPQSRVL